MTDPGLRDAILQALAALAPGRSLAPADIARGLAAGEWHALLPRIRREALSLAREGRLDILRKGRRADPAGEIRGVIRLRLPGGSREGPAPEEDAGD